MSSLQGTDIRVNESTLRSSAGLAHKDGIDIASLEMIRIERKLR